MSRGWVKAAVGMPTNQNNTPHDDDRDCRSRGMVSGLVSEPKSDGLLQTPAPRTDIPDGMEFSL